MNARSAGSQAQPLRSVNMNTYTAQPNARQTPRLQNTQKTGLGNGNAGAGWAFGAPSSAGGFAGLGGAPGLGQARPGQLSGFAQVMGGGNGQGPIDMSDFPSLAGSARPQQAASGWNSNVIRQPNAHQQSAPQPSQQQQQQQQQQPQPRAPSTVPSHQSLDQFDGQRSQQSAVDRNGGGDEFPPLGGQLNGNSGRPGNGFAGTIGSSASMLPQSNGPPSTLNLTDLAASFEANVVQAQARASSVRSSHSNQATSTGSKPWAEMTEQDRWGLGGLNKMLDIVKAMQTGGEIDPTVPPSVRNGVMMTMGHDLNDLGLDLESSEPLYKTFHAFPDMNNIGTTFDSRARAPIPTFNVPAAYYVNNVPPIEDRIAAFSEETLFQIFFTNPRDLKQELAAGELTARDWRWHKVIRQWIQKDTREANASSVLPVVDHTSGAPIGVDPVRLSSRTERGVYIFFNHHAWSRERREFILNWDELDHRSVGVAHGFAGPNTVEKA